MYVIAFVLHLLDVWFTGLDGLYVVSVSDMIFCCLAVAVGAIQNEMPSCLLTFGISLVCWFWFVIELSVV